MFEHPCQLPLALRLPGSETLASFLPAGDASWLAWLQQQLDQPALPCCLFMARRLAARATCCMP